MLRESRQPCARLNPETGETNSVAGQVSGLAFVSG